MEFLEDEFNEILKIFQVESEEIVARLNNNLLELEKKPNSKDIILLLFRDSHSLKGASRMVGFDNVQTLAHKLEDILGLAKDDQLQLNTKIIDVMYKTVDYLSDAIEKSIAMGKEYYDENIAAQVAILDNIKDFEEYEKQDDKTNLNLDFLTKKNKEINTLISEVLFMLMIIEIEKDESLLEKLLADFKALYNIFQEVGLFEIKKGFEDISVKLEFVNKATHNLTVKETEEIQQTLDTIITNLVSIYELHNLEVVDYYSVAFETFSKKQEMPSGSITIDKIEDFETIVTEIEEKFEQEIADEEVIDEESSSENHLELKFLQDKFSSLSQNHNYLFEINEFLTKFEDKCENEDVKHIIQIIIKILNYARENEIKLDDDTISALWQSIDYCDNIINNVSENIDKSLILQRLEIVQQVLELNTESDKEDLSLQKKGYKIKNKKIADLSSIFETGEIKTLRVDSTKLDTLVNQVGELIITKIKTKKHLHELNVINTDLEEWQRQSIKALNYLKYYDKKHFGQLKNEDSHISFFIKQLLNLFGENNKKFGDTISGISGLHRSIQEDDVKMKLIVDELESTVKNIRVLPLATIFHLFGRMVRDIAQEKNKRIDLEIIGSETSTDKKIIEEIKTPLIHIIRNAIDHGIETPEERIALGKNPVGKIILKATQIDSKVMIEIQDDGKGINIEKIKEKALQKGYLTKEEINSMSDEQITNLIFAPGFSTGEEITNISGRGIGLDVVHTKISQLNGKVNVISAVNKGCCVQIELPTTMSTLKSFLVKASNRTFAIPMSAINIVMLKKSEEIFSEEGKRVIIFNGKSTPIYDLTEVLNLPKIELQREKLRETILIIESDNKTIGLVVDKLIGDQEILQKKLSAPLYRLKNISGVTTLETGELCLILNIADLLKSIASPNLISYKTQTAPKLIDNQNYKILLVDDSITTRTLEKNILTMAGYKIEIAQNPIEAFEKMSEMRFDLIISDVEMPEMDGFEFLKRLKTDEMYFDIPVIMVSSLVVEENQKLAKKLGAEEYIIKDEFNQEEFLGKVISVLKKHSN